MVSAVSHLIITGSRSPISIESKVTVCAHNVAIDPIYQKDDIIKYIWIILVLVFSIRGDVNGRRETGIPAGYGSSGPR